MSTLLRRSPALSCLLAVSLALSAMQPALAQEEWPSGRGAAAPPQTRAAAPPLDAPATLAGSAAAVTLPAAAWLAPHETLIPAGRTQPIAAPENTASGTSDASDAAGATGAAGVATVDLLVHLALPSLARAVGGQGAAAARSAYAATVAAAQERIAGEVAAQGGKVIYRFSTLSSALAVQTPAHTVSTLAGIAGVSQVTRVGDYGLNLGAVAANAGVAPLPEVEATGAGVSVALLDSGIDYTHLAFGGPGVAAAWHDNYYGGDPACDPAAAHDADCAYARPPSPALFGAAAPRVKGGFDYVGEAWAGPGDRLLPDPNPIDRFGHGTQMAAILGGQGYPAGVNDGGPYPALPAGAAPGVDLYAFKVCAAASTACSGLALLAALDDAADLDDLPATHDPADIVTLALSAAYGQPEDSLTHLADEASRFGMLVVAAAGNSGNRPFVVGSPAAGDGPLAVAETAAATAARYPLTYAFAGYGGYIYNTVHQHWSAQPAGERRAGLLYYGQTADERRGCTLDAAGAPLPGYNPLTGLAGRVVLLDRGGCDFYVKAANAAAAGARLVLIGLTAPGDPFAANPAPGVAALPAPVLMIDQAAADMLRAGSASGVIVGLNPADAVNLAFSVAPASARGPRNNDGAIKPDLAAPGLAMAARTGSGAGGSLTAGASSATALAAGLAALLKEAHGAALAPAQMKALLMNSATLHVRQDDLAGSLAQITRIGGGQVDLRAALASSLIAWDSTAADPLAWTGSLSFGYVPASRRQTITRTLTIQNLAALPQTVQIDSYFRYLEDYAQGVYVTPGLDNVTVLAGSVVTVPIVLEIDPPAALHRWVLDRGQQGANGELLRYQEYDGYVRITPRQGAPLHVVWQALPRAAAETQLGGARGQPGAVSLVNPAPGVAGVTEVFDLVTADGNDYHYVVGDCARLGLPPGCDLSPVDIHAVGVRHRLESGGGAPVDVLEFAVTLWDEPHRASQTPAEVRIYIDADADGRDDYVVFNRDAAGDLSDGRSAVFVMNLAEGVARPHRFVDGAFNSQNTILPVELAAIGAAPGQPLRFSVFVYSTRGTVRLWDCAPKVGFLCTGAHAITPGAPRFAVPAGQRTLTVPAAGAVDLAWTSSPEGDAATPAQIGLLFLHRNAHVGRESDPLLIAPPYLPAAAVALAPAPELVAGAAHLLTATVTITGAGKAAAPAVGHEVFFTEGVFTAELTGGAGGGQATFRRDPATGAVRYTLDFTGVTTPTMALLHLGAAGTNGPAHFWLWDVTGANAPRRLPATGVFTPTAAFYSQMLQGNLYVNVHSAAEGTGLRGQMARTPSAFTDGQGVAALLWRATRPGAHTIYAVAGPGGDAIQVAVIAKMFLPLVELQQD